MVGLLLMDGSVRVIKGSNKVQTSCAPGTMANGEVIGDDAS